MSVGPPPVWLEDELEITSLLGVVLDRFDRQPGDERQRQVVVPAERHLPSLSRADPQADQSWELVRELERLGLVGVRLARHNPLDPEWTGAKLAFPPASEPLLREWLRREWTEPVMQLWRRAVESHASEFPHGCQALLSRRVGIQGRSAEDVVAAFARIARFNEPVTLRQLSASVFWGDSKVLDNRGDLITALFPNLEIRDRPLIVAVFLPTVWRGTLFIENQDTYIAATGGFPAACRELALVYAAGFRGAASYIRNRNSVLLHYAGPGVPTLQHPFEQWWFESGPAPGPSAFWGDLDFAGMQILKALRNRFPDLVAWRPGYDGMLDVLRSRGGYDSPATADPTQADPQTTGCPFADGVLLPAIREQGHVDQECVVASLESAADSEEDTPSGLHSGDP